MKQLDPEFLAKHGTVLDRMLQMLEISERLVAAIREAYQEVDLYRDDPFPEKTIRKHLYKLETECVKELARRSKLNLPHESLEDREASRRDSREFAGTLFAFAGRKKKGRRSRCDDATIHARFILCQGLIERAGSDLEQCRKDSPSGRVDDAVNKRAGQLGEGLSHRLGLESGVEIKKLLLSRTTPRRLAIQLTGMLVHLSTKQVERRLRNLDIDQAKKS